MARDTLELDLRRALQSLGQLDQALSGTAAKFSRDLSNAVSNLERAGASTTSGPAAGLRAVGTEASKTATAVGQYERANKSAEQSARVFEQQLKRQEDGLSKVGVAAGVAGAAVAGGLFLAVRATAQFDAALSQVGAVSNASAKQLDQLRSAALEAGAATIFSASEAAQAQVELAKAGVSTADILGGGLRGALDLAAAGQLGLADAAVIAAQAMTTFKLSGADVGHIADVLASGANKGVSSVSSLGEALGSVGPLASQMSLSLEETVGTLALFEQNAIRGSEAGTNLRRFLLSLVAPSKEASSVMRQYGIDVFDATGKFIGLAGAAESLRRGLGPLTEEQRQAALATIFGAFAIQGANVLYKEGEVGVRRWTKAVNDQGAASRFAGAIMDNLAGDIEELRGAFETGLIGAGSQATAVLRFLTQGLTEIVRTTSELPGPVQAVAFGLVSLTAGGLGLVSVVGTLIPKFQQVNLALETLAQRQGLTGAAAGLLAGRLGLIARGAVGLTAFFAIGPQLEKLTGDFTSAGAAAGALSGALIGGLPGAAIGLGLGAIAGGLGLLGSEAKKAEEAVGKLASTIDGMTKAQATRSFLESIGGEAILKAIGGDVDDLRKRFEQLAKATPDSARKVLDGLRAMRTDSGKPILDEKVINQLERDLGRAEVAFGRRAERQREAAEANAAFAGSQDLVIQKSEEEAKAFEELVESLTKNVPASTSILSDAIKAAQDVAKEQEKALDPNVLIRKYQERLQATVDFTTNLRKLVAEGFVTLAADLAALGPEAAGEITQAFIDAAPATRAAADLQARQAREIAGNLTGFIRDELAPQLAGIGIEVGTAIPSGVASGLGSEAAQTGILEAGKVAGRRAQEGVQAGIAEGKQATIDAAAAAALDLGGAAEAIMLQAGTDTGEGYMFAQAEALRRSRDAALFAAVDEAAQLATAAEDQMRRGGDAAGEAFDASLAAGILFDDAGQRAQQEALRVTEGAAAIMFDGGFGVGAALNQGIGAGLSATEQALLRQVMTNAQTAVDAYKASLGIASPSKVFTTIGEEMVAGLIIGLERSETLIDRAGRRFGLRAVRAVQDPTLRGSAATSVSSTTSTDRSFHAFEGATIIGRDAVAATNTASRRLRAASFFGSR